LNDTDVITAVLSELRSALSVPVHTPGREADLELPYVLVDLERTIRDPDQGSGKTYLGVARDENGVAIGEVHVLYYLADFDLTVRTTSEEERDDLLTALEAAFCFFEDVPTNLDSEIYSVEVGGAARRVLAFREPDWFEGSRGLTIGYASLHVLAADALSTLNISVDAVPDVESYAP
jgi:hypothetical protein